jgi:predicted transposase/invertase (TIGR01784 family)
MFNDRLEKEMDDWLHVMKYDEVPPNYHSPYMKQVEEKLSILKMTPEEREKYSYYQKKLHNDRDELKAAEARGEARGVEKGREEEKKKRNKEKEEIVINMLKQNLDDSLIASITGLSLDVIITLKNKL